VYLWRFELAWNGVHDGGSASGALQPSGGGKLGQDSLPVRVPKPGSCLPRAPTDPDVPNSGTVADPAVGGW